MSDLKNRITTAVEQAAEQGDAHGLFRKPLVGFASAADPLFDKIPEIVGAHHLKPADILPGVATVVSFFIPFTKEVINGNKGGQMVSREWGQAYLEANSLINDICVMLIDLVTEAGHQAAMVPATYGFDEKTLATGWSHRSAAFVAGLGRFGLNRMLIGPLGCGGRYGTVFISAELEPDERPVEEPCLYFKKEGGCQACLKACPTQALALDGFDGQKCYQLVLENSRKLDLGQLCDVCGKCVVAGPCAYH